MPKVHRVNPPLQWMLAKIQVGWTFRSPTKRNRNIITRNDNKKRREKKKKTKRKKVESQRDRGEPVMTEANFDRPLVFWPYRKTSSLAAMAVEFRLGRIARSVSCERRVEKLAFCLHHRPTTTTRRRKRRRRKNETVRVR